MFQHCTTFVAPAFNNPCYMICDKYYYYLVRDQMSYCIFTYLCVNRDTKVHLMDVGDVSIVLQHSCLIGTPLVGMKLFPLFFAEVPS